MKTKEINVGFIKSEMIDISELIPFQEDIKDLSEENHAKLWRQIVKNGFSEPFTVWQTEDGNFILNGHQRLKVLSDMRHKNIPIPKLPCNIVFCRDKRQAKELVLSLASQFGKVQKEALKDYFDNNQLTIEDLKDICLPEIDLDSFAKDLEVVVEDEPEEKGEKPDSDDEPEKPDEPVSVHGDIWSLGDHRVMCGDSTRLEDVSRLISKQKPKLMVTHPPYGEYKPEWRSVKAKTATDFSDWREVYAWFQPDIVYIWHPFLYYPLIEDALSLKYKIHSQIVWPRKSFVLDREEYHAQHESCIYAVKKDINNNWQNKKHQTTVWNIEIDEEDLWPIEAMQRPIENSSEMGQVVCDPFLGTGTTLIACNAINRICLGMEVQPVFVDKTIERWQQISGKEAVLLSSGKSFSEVKEERNAP